jgi:hypothetical protein
MPKQKELKAKKCRVCTFPFFPRASTQVVCSPRCALELNKINKGKAYDRKTKELKQAIKTRGDYNKEAQTAINRYVRARDFKDLCISCGNPNFRGRYDAGHFLSIGSDCSLRFNLLNIHKQCHWNCNISRSGNQIRYRKRLIKKIGIDKVDWLEGPHDALKYTIEDLKRIKRIFTKKAQVKEQRNYAK